MNRTLNQLINQLHLDPKKEAAARKLIQLVSQSSGGSNGDNNTSEPGGGTYDDTEIKAQIKENTDNIAANKADADAKLTELGLEVEKLGFTSVCSDIHLDKYHTWYVPSEGASLNRLKGYYNINGEFIEGNETTCQLNVNYGQLIKIVFDYTNYINDVLMVSFWKDGELVSDVISSNVYNSLNDTFILEIPFGVDAVMVTMANTIYFSDRDLIDESIKASDNITNIQKIIDELDIKGGNKINLSQIYANYGIDNTGAIVNANWNLCVVPVNINTTYYIKCDEYRNNKIGMMGYSKNPDVIFGNKMNSVNLSELPGYEGYKVFTTDGDTNYLFINKTPLLTDNKVGIWEYLDPEYPTTIGEREISKKLNRFSDKKIAIFGDSITWLGLSGQPNKGWTTHFKEIMKFGEFTNYARSGATWSNTENTVYDIEENIGTIGDNNVIYNQVNRLIYDIEQGSKVPDYIMFVAGCNDIWYESQRPNAMSKTAEEVFEDASTDYLSKSINECTSIAESIRYVAEMLIQKCPNTQVVICSPLQMTKGSFKVAQKIGNIIKESGEYLGWNVIEQSKECGISRLQETRGYYNTYDGAHTSEIGAKKVAGILAAKCNAIFAK